MYNSMKNILNDIINLPRFRIPTVWQEAGSWSLFTKFKTTNIMSKQLVRARCKHYVTISLHNSDNIQLLDSSLNIKQEVNLKYHNSFTFQISLSYSTFQMSVKNEESSFTKGKLSHLPPIPAPTSPSSRFDRSHLQTHRRSDQMQKLLLSKL